MVKTHQNEGQVAGAAAQVEHLLRAEAKAFASSLQTPMLVQIQGYQAVNQIVAVWYCGKNSMKGPILSHFDNLLRAGL